VLGEEGEKELKIPSGTQPDEILSLPGGGMPTLRRNKRGDLFVKIAVKIPKKLRVRKNREKEKIFGIRRRNRGGDER
jgi:molecular chaperone DnaJ